MIKIYNGTPVGENLCDSCENIRIVQGIRESDEIRNCAALKGKINFRVAKCSYFSRKEVSNIDQDEALVLKYDEEDDRLKIYKPTGMFSGKYFTPEEYYKDTQRLVRKKTPEEKLKEVIN